MMEKLNTMMTEMCRFITGPSHRKVDENTGAWKKVTNGKVKLIKEIVIEATEEQKRAEAEEKRRKKIFIIY